MSARSALCLALLAGCGRVGFDDTGAIDAPPCRPTAWAAPQPQGQLRSVDNDWEATLHPNGLVLVFSRQTATDADLWVATRATTTADFGNPTKIPAASSGTSYEFGPVWSPDGTQLTFQFDDNVAVSEARTLDHLGGASFSSSFTVADMPDNSFSWELTPDGLELFYTTVEPTLDYDIHHATRTSTSASWVDDDAVESLRRVGPSEGWPAYDPARGILYFERDDNSGAVLAEAKRPAPGERFELIGPTAIAPGRDGDPDLSDDGLTLVFSSRRLGGTGNDIFLTTRSCQ